MIQVACSGCGAKLKVKDELAGRSGKCPKCGAKVQIPIPAAVPATEPEPAPVAQSNNALELLPDLSTFASEILDPDTTINETVEKDVEEELYDASSEVLHAARETPGNDNNDDNEEPIPFDSLFDEDDESTPILIRPEGGGLGGAISGSDETAERTFDDSISPEDVPDHLAALNHYMVCDHKDVVARFEHDDRGWMVKLKDGFVRAKLVAGKIPQFGKFVLVEVGVKQSDDGLHLEFVHPFRLADQYALNKLAKGDDAILSAITGRSDLSTAQKGHVRDLVKKHFLPQVAAEVDQFMK